MNVNVEPKKFVDNQFIGEPRYNQFITAMDMGQLKKVASGIRRINFNLPKDRYMKDYDDFLKKELPEIKEKIKMSWTLEVVDSCINSLTSFAASNWKMPKDLANEFRITADYIEKVSNGKG